MKIDIKNLYDPCDIILPGNKECWHDEDGNPEYLGYEASIEKNLKLRTIHKLDDGHFCPTMLGVWVEQFVTPN